MIIVLIVLIVLAVAASVATGVVAHSDSPTSRPYRDGYNSRNPQ